MKLSVFRQGGDVARGRVGINPEAITYVGEASDVNSSTVVGLSTGEKLIVAESFEEVVKSCTANSEN